MVSGKVIRSLFFKNPLLTGIVDFHAVGKSNPHQPVNFVCAAISQDVQTPLPPHPYQVWMTKNDLNGPRIEHVSTLTSSLRHEGVVQHGFTIPGATVEDVFYCRLSVNGSGQYAVTKAQLYGKR